MLTNRDWPISRGKGDYSSPSEYEILLTGILNASLNGVYALRAVRDDQGKIIDFNYLFANRHVAEALSVSTEDIMRASMLELIPENRDNGFFELFRTVIESGQSSGGQTHFQTSKVNRWFDYMIVPINSDDVVVTVHDITVEKEVQNETARQKELMDLVVENSTSGLLYCNSIRGDDGRIEDFRVVFSNTMLAEMAGFADVHEFSRLTLKEIHERTKAEDLNALYIRVVETGQTQNFEYFLASRSRWFSMNVVKSGDGFLLTCVDITNTKQLQLQLQDAVENLRRSNKNLEEFAFAASHDLKEPLRKILVFAHRLRENLEAKLDDDDKHYFARLLNSAGRMTSLIENLLSFANVTVTGRAYDPVDLNEVIDLVTEDLELEIESHNATIDVAQLPVVTGNKRQLQQLFQNLISNSLKYTRSDTKPHITISGESNGDCERVIVQDNGVGFHMEDAEKIFNVFTRLHELPNTKGTGLGLSIARRVVENHGGKISATSEPGSGATFIVELPKDGTG